MTQNVDARPVTIHVCAFQVVVLDTDGSPKTGTKNMYVTDRIMQLQYQLAVTAGAQRKLVTGCNAVAAQMQEADELDRYTFAMDTAGIEPRLLAMLTGANVVYDSSVVPAPKIIDNPQAGTLTPPPVAVSVWSDAYEGGEQVVDPYAYVRYIWPQTRWRVSDKTLLNDAASDALVGYTEPNSGWGVGLGDQGGTIGSNGAICFVDALPAITSPAYGAVA